ncbi:MAG: hypothetical protein J1E97_01225 [Muribaculaceae bacterium]|nr:hypothetical protein [Muribaculaceae bacterium]
MKQDSIPNAQPDSGAQHPQKEFQGYSLDELRYQRALLLLKREILREQVSKDTKRLRNSVPLLGGKSSISASGIVGRVAKGLNFADYLMLGFSLFNVGRKLVSLFSRKKK